jgi:DNA (cytosine-5)-methyltransferase 3A
MNILSLFDGMSCGQIALRQLGIPINKYYAAEIDPYAMRVTQNNFPDTIHLGDVTKVKGEDLEKIDLLLGGSPCQGFSFAGKQLNFDDPRSALFFEYVRLLKECNPKYFLLENVRMKKEYQDVITEHLGVEPIMINSALVSAQNRVRLYWTNIPNITQPKDKGIVLKDVLEETPDNFVKMSNTFTARQKGNRCLTDMTQKKASNLSAMEYVKNGRQGDYIACNNSGSPIQIGIADDINGHDILKRVYSPEGKSPTLTTMQGGNTQPKVALYENEQPHKDNYKKLRDESEEKVLATQMNNSKNFGNAVREKKAFTLRASNPNGMINKEQYYYRKLTPLECERLQTVPDGYTEGVSNTQRYKMLGNGWTIEVIKHVLQNIT